jgi:hypothetical protein
MAKGKSGGKKLSAAAAGEPPVVTAEKPWDRMTKGEKLSFATDLGLDVVKAILELGVDPSNPKVLNIVKETALTVVSTQVKVDQEKMRAAREAGGSLQEFYRQYGSTSEERSS